MKTVKYSSDRKTFPRREFPENVKCFEVNNVEICRVNGLRFLRDIGDNDQELLKCLLTVTRECVWEIRRVRARDYGVHRKRSDILPEQPSVKTKELCQHPRLVS
ncbi:hypothetical protein TNCV_1381911 [Trichonephila clavipes]|nr:hypothetical protein TNCV_1381911 [Trichonephila clavipes]